MKFEDLENQDPAELGQKLKEALMAATRMANAVKTVQTILERTFDKETLDAICFVMQGPDAVGELKPSERIAKITHACNKIEDYYHSMGRVQ